jgi:hypothetical protein
LRVAPTIVGIEDFRQRLIRAFPPQPYHGLISTHDECDDGIHLRREFPGKRWDELSPDVIFHGSIALPLLAPDALVAFLPAWLLRSIETFDPESIVLEFTLYFLCPGNEDEGWDEKRIAETVSLFDATQRIVVGDFLRSILESDTVPYWHPYAEQGLKWGK